MFINEHPDGITSQHDIYVDDTTIYSCLSIKSDQFAMVELAADVKNNTQSFLNWGK